MRSGVPSRRSFVGEAYRVVDRRALMARSLSSLFSYNRFSRYQGLGFVVVLDYDILCA